MKKRGFLIASIFVLVGILIGSFAVRLDLFLDDFVLIFPAVLRTFSDYFYQYIYDYGLYRPLAVLYHYIVFSSYLASPAMIHGFGWGVHWFSGILLFKVLRRQAIESKWALIISLIFLVHPFAVEQYAWLSAFHTTVVNLIFLLQVLVILGGRSLKLRFWLVWCLQLVALLFFESTFFLFVPLAYLLSVTSGRRGNFSEWVRRLFRYLVLFLIIPILYVGLRQVFPPHIETRVFVSSIGEFAVNSVSLVESIARTFLTPSFFTFWLRHGVLGFSFIVKNNWLLATFIGLVVALGYWVWKGFGAMGDLLRPKRPVVVFWSLSLLMSLFPLLALKEFNFPFRALFLPVGLLWLNAIFGMMSFVRSRLIAQLMAFLMMLVVVLFVVVDLGMLVRYRQQSEDDNRLRWELKSLLLNEGFSDNRPAFVLLKDFPRSTVESRLIHAEYVVSCFNYHWCAQAAMNMITGAMEGIRIQFSDGYFSADSEIYDGLLRPRPLVEIEYRGGGFDVMGVKE